MEELLPFDRLHEICSRYDLDAAEICSIGGSLTATIQEVKRHLPQSYFLDNFHCKHARLNDAFQ